MLHIYRASAGSGKTYTLTKDYIHLLFGASNRFSMPHRKIMAVTFTNKATEEMKSRIIEELNYLAKGEKSDFREDLMLDFKLSAAEVNQKAKSIMINILHDYSGFTISTIDKFFQKVVRSFAREVGINGGYNVELNNDYVLQQALENLFLTLGDKGSEQLVGWLSDFMEGKVDEGKSWAVKQEIMSFGDEIFKENFQHKAVQTHDRLFNKEFLNEYRKELKKIKEEFETKVIKEHDVVVSCMEKHGVEISDLKGKGKGFDTQLRMIKVDKNYDLGNMKKISSYAKGVDECYTKTTKESIKSAIESAYYGGMGQALNNIVTLLSGEEMINYNSADLILNNLNTLGIMADLAIHIKELSQEQNFMLISDTNQLLNKIVDGSDAPFVYERIGSRINHFMIDEFQDTSVLQWKNFKPLINNSMGEGYFNMLVGDVKQSIYRWRNSDWKLLGEQINRDFHAEQITEKTLDTNWRSDSNVIHFNNSFFKNAVEVLQSKLNSEIDSFVAIDDAKFSDIHEKITNAYADTEQKVSPRGGVGYVQVEFIEKEEDNNEEAIILSRLPKLIEEIIDRGYKASDIGFLVRNKKEAVAITEEMMAYRNSEEARSDLTYELVGNEGLTLSLSRSINFLLSILRLIINPNDEISRVTMHQEYLVAKKGMSEEEAVRSSFVESENSKSFHSSLFSENENSTVANLVRKSLFEAVEKIIDVFDLKSWHDEAVFLQAFQDEVYKFAGRQNNDINGFLEYWDEQSHKFRITIPENENASSIMTIHAAKGLDFKVVVIPFATWEFIPRYTLQPLLWCETEVAPFNQLPLMPIKSSKKMLNSVFRDEYVLELMQQYVDNINVAYVAFTRARNEMYCFAKKPSELSLKKGLDGISNLSNLLYDVIDNSVQWSENWDKESNLFMLGEKLQIKTVEKKSSVDKLNDYPISDAANRLKIKRQRPNLQEDKQENAISYGLLMHDILRQVIVKDDLERVLKTMLFNGKINQKSYAEIKLVFEEFWKDKQVASWFNGQGEVLNETSIFLPNGEKYRPDRVILRNNKAIVIDYKFGEEERKSYLNQLANYSKLLVKMGYEVEAYIYYVALKKLVALEE